MLVLGQMKKKGRSKFDLSSSFIQGFPSALWTSQPTKLNRFDGGLGEVETQDNGTAKLHTSVVAIPYLHFLFFPSFSLFFLILLFLLLLPPCYDDDNDKTTGKKAPHPSFFSIKITSLVITTIKGRRHLFSMLNWHWKLNN